MPADAGDWSEAVFAKAKRKVGRSRAGQGDERGGHHSPRFPIAIQSHMPPV